jgi:ATP-dependent DNA ligase
MLPSRIRTDGFVTPGNPTRATQPPSGPDWVHEIKHDGYRLIVRRDGLTVRLFTRRGYDWTDRYPAIAAAAAKLRARSFTLDGEAAVRGLDGIAVFDALHRRRRVSDATCRHSPSGAQWRGFTAAAPWQAKVASDPATGPLMVPTCFGMHVPWAWRASCRSG